MKFLASILLFAISFAALAQTSPTIRLDDIASLQALRIPSLTTKFSALVAGYSSATDTTGWVNK